MDAFRAIRPENFSPDALRMLFAYYEELEESTGEEIELDVIAICCEWAEYTAEELIQEYGYLVDDEHNPRSEEDAADWLADLVRELMDQTTVIPVDDDVYLVMAF